MTQNEAEAKGQIERLIISWARSCIAHSGIIIDPMYLGKKHKNSSEIVTEIFTILKQAGYRLVRPDDLKVLTKEEMKAINNAMPPEAKYGDVFDAVAHAQLAADKKALEEM